MKSVKDRIKDSFNLNVDPEVEFQKFAAENNLVNDNEIMFKFNDYKKKSLIGFISLGILLAVSVV